MSKKAISVTIMIATYNQPQYIEAAIESALGQDYENLEVLVSDDSDNSETDNIVRKYSSDHRFQYHKNKENIGRVANYRKLLFELAKGDWVLMLDGDDYLIDNNYISKAISIVKKKPSVVLIGAGIKILYSTNDTLVDKPLIENDSIFDGSNVLTEHLFLPNHQTDLYPRTLAHKLDFYRDPSMASDSESLFRLCLHGDVCFLSNIVAVWRIHENNTTFTLNIKKQISELIFVEKVYQYSLAHIENNLALSWRNFMYNFMADCIMALDKVSNRDRYDLLFTLNKYLSYKNKINIIKCIVRKHLSTLKAVINN